MEYFDGDEKRIAIHKPSFIYPIMKRIFDIVMSLLALMFLSPIFLFVLIMNLICKSNRGPLFYRHVRIGLKGEKFGMYKFRSMIVKAEERLQQDKELYAKYVANNYKLKPEDDPRVTKIGRFLRKSSIDEIPQFINVLKGEMSLVGPRPVIEAELKEYDHEKLLSVKPGAMGLWQASGRSHIGYPERARIEMRYIDQACMLFDMKIIIGNFVSVFKGKGAY
ncbi:sugar transferase [Companilactobacillus heilongjiangensis]|uniref:Multidrug MFS transporter n=1 Tax=Companilactobacillus heilongjiangensis TaxID=1074467 RepID=A0A0K2LE43_9LACO|nr:multidrug MFS transporter [Companilactobacillus heilongjiangensis]